VTYITLFSHKKMHTYNRPT